MTKTFTRIPQFRESDEWPLTKSLEVRLAKPSDAKLVARLCRRAAGSGDYVLRILRETIAERGMFLAWSGDELVGMTNLAKSVDGSGWLSMARTDPRWRRKGVALFMQRHVTAHAGQRRMRILRLWTLSTNTASIKACTKGGFKPVCEAAHVSCSIRRRRGTTSLATKQRSARPLLDSHYLRNANGYFAYKWYFIKATRQMLKRLRREGELYQDDESAFILTRPEVSFGVSYCSFTLLHGPAVSSLRKVKKAAAAFGRVWLGGYLPYGPHLLRSAETAGFKRDPWAKHCVVFEKKI